MAIQRLYSLDAFVAVHVLILWVCGAVSHTYRQYRRCGCHTLQHIGCKKVVVSLRQLLAIVRVLREVF